MYTRLVSSLTLKLCVEWRKRSSIIESSQTTYKLTVAVPNGSDGSATAITVGHAVWWQSGDDVSHAGIHSGRRNSAQDAEIPMRADIGVLQVCTCTSTMMAFSCRLPVTFKGFKLRRAPTSIFDYVCLTVIGRR